MTEYTKVIPVRDADPITINVPVDEPNVYITFLDFETAMSGNTVDLMSEDGTTLIQTVTTNDDGTAHFTSIAHGNYTVKITY